MTNKIKVVVAGALGRMGSEAVETFLAAGDKFELVAALVRKLDGVAEHQKEAFTKKGVRLSDDLKEVIHNNEVDVLVELTTPASVYQNSKFALENGVRPVVGATGLSDEELQYLAKLSDRNKIGAIIAPNFAIGAILMMQFAQKAAKYMDKCEIIEMHHDKKVDAPSGTALKTAKIIKDARPDINSKDPCEHPSTANYENIPIHSLRLPGLVAHQLVVYGGVGQTLTIRHDSIDRSSFMPGIKLCAEKVMGLEHLVYGMENIL